MPLLLSPITLRNYRGECAATLAAPTLPAATTDADFRTRMLIAQESSYLDARRRPFIHLVDGGLSDNLGVRRLLDRALAGGGLRGTFQEVRIAPGSVRRLVLIAVNSERDPAKRIDEVGTVPSTVDVVDALLFGTGARATTETQEYLTDITRRWQADIRDGGAGPRSVFARDAEIHVIQVNLRDAPEGDVRRALLQVPTAFSISGAEVTSLIEAGRTVLRRSPQFQALRRSLDAAAAP